ncbi:TonB-dependent receptor [Puniceicoccaceae bacterium K14]|nr:TonB-dependent receptor [Puniceicoccaceae bacterium K14]
MQSQLLIYFLVGMMMFVAAPSCLGDDGYHDLSLEELARMPVVESSKSDVKLFDAPNGAFVFDEEAIQNLPVDSIPELLRYAPGTHIMRTNNGNWGLAIRGMNSRFFGRALFTVDEQSIYGSIFNGLFGNDHDLLLDDVASVEVVYGPGGTLWGTNAANGRVNVLLKTAFETEGTALKTRVGTQNRSVDARYGWIVGESSAARVWAKKSDRQSSADSFSDAWKSSRAGIRFDSRPSSGGLLNLSVEVSESELGVVRNVLDFETGLAKMLTGLESQRGLNAQAKWTHQVSPEIGYSARAWTGFAEFRSLSANYDIKLLGTEVRGVFNPLDKHKFTFSLGATTYEKTLINTTEISFVRDYDPRDTNAHIGGEYIFTLSPDTVQMSIGLNGTYDSYTNEVTPLPSARVIFFPTEKSRAWLAYSSSSRAIPSGLTEIEHMRGTFLPVGPIEIPTPSGIVELDTQLLDIVTSKIDTIEKERLDAIEIGYRMQQENGNSFVITGFANQYKNIMGLRDFRMRPILDVQSPFLLNQSIFANIANGESYGLEISRTWILSSDRNLVVNYSYIEDDFEALDQFQGDFGLRPLLQAEIDTLNNNVPAHQASIWYSHGMGDWRADLGLRYNSKFESPRSIQWESLQCDLRLTWSKSEDLRISIVGRNLFDSDTNETYLKNFIGTGSELPREAYLEINLKF